MKDLAEAVGTAHPVYEIPEDDLVGDVLVPAMSVATEVCIAAGFFSSRCLTQIAPGLATYLKSSDQPLRLLISPAIEAEDREALDRGLRTPDDVIRGAIQRLLNDAALSESALVHHTLDCLAYLIAVKRLAIRFVLMREGMYHKKQWLLHDGNHWLAVHGSGNATARGLLVNGEQMTIDRPWQDGPASEKRVTRLLAGWDRQWNNESPHSLCIELEDGLNLTQRQRGRDDVPTIDDFWRAWQADHVRGLEPKLPPGIIVNRPRLLSIPSSLEWRSGTFGHQRVAVDAFFAAGTRGILAIATGGGKTSTALIAATQEQERHRGPMLVLVLVPSTPLMNQWADAVRDFGIEPLVPSSLTAPKRGARLEELRAALATPSSYAAIIVSTQQLFLTDSSLRAFIDDLPPEVLTMIIGDEVHNLGVPSFLNTPPTRFDSRLGLSATPMRQYDIEGSARLLEFFGPQVFEFGLVDAIRAGCLTPYTYHLHEVELDDSEMDLYRELTQRLRRRGFSVDDEGQSINLDSQIDSLLRRRRAILEQANAKIAKLRGLLEETGPRKVGRTLIYASAKSQALSGKRQLLAVNALLRDLGIRFHEFTNAETSRSGAQALLDAFGAGDYQVLTAMKVLDEGVDIPQTDTAYLLASSTVHREWIQRRGRILRQATGKKHAVLHDFLVIPPDTKSKEARAILRGELARAREFADAAENEFDADGPREVISRYEQFTWTGDVV